MVVFVAAAGLGSLRDGIKGVGVAFLVDLAENLGPLVPAELDLADHGHEQVGVGLVVPLGGAVVSARHRGCCGETW